MPAKYNVRDFTKPPISSLNLSFRYQDVAFLVSQSWKACLYKCFERLETKCLQCFENFCHTKHCRHLVSNISELNLAIIQLVVFNFNHLRCTKKVVILFKKRNKVINIQTTHNSLTNAYTRTSSTDKQMHTSNNPKPY